MRIASRINAHMPNQAIRSARKAPLAKSVDSLAFGANPTVGAKANIFRRFLDGIVKIFKNIWDKLINIVFPQSKPTNTPDVKKPAAEKTANTTESSKEKPAIKDKTSETEKKPAAKPEQKPTEEKTKSTQTPQKPEPKSETPALTAWEISQKIRNAQTVVKDCEQRESEVRSNIRTLQAERQALKKQGVTKTKALETVKRDIYVLENIMRHPNKPQLRYLAEYLKQGLPPYKNDYLQKMGKAWEQAQAQKFELETCIQTSREVYEAMKSRCAEERALLIGLKDRIQALKNELEVLKISQKGQKTLESLK